MDPVVTPPQNVSGMSGAGELSLYQYFISSPLFAQFVDFEGNDRKAFLAQYVSLPPSLKNYLSSTETASTIVTTGINYELDDAQVSKIAETIRELIVGKVFIKDFPTTISSKLGIDDVKAAEIVNKIVSQSFGPIIEDVKRIQRTNFPDKVMSMQKESQPAGLTQPTARPDLPQAPKPAAPPPPKAFVPPTPEEIKNKPLTQPGARQDVPSVRPPIAPSSNQAQSVRPPQVTQPAPSPAPAQTPARPPVPQSPIDFSQVREAQNTPVQNTPTQPQPPVQVAPPPEPAKPQFKMPNLDQVPPGKEPVKPSQQASKSLEDELEKVASVIDLRTQSKE